MAYYALKKDVFDINKVTVVGNPTITADGVASGLNAENYIVPFSDITLGDDFEMYLPFKLTSIMSGRQLFYRGQYGSRFAFLLGADSKIIRFNFRSSTMTLPSELVIIPNVELNIDYIVKLKLKNGLLSYGYFKNNTYTHVGELETTLVMDNINWFRFGGATSTSAIINMPEFKIYINGQLAYSPTKPTYLLERRKEGYDPSKFTIIGSPTITEYGVASGFNSGNKIQAGVFYGEVFQYEFTAKIGSFTAGVTQYLCQGFKDSTNLSSNLLIANINKLWLVAFTEDSVYTNVGSYIISENTEYNIKAIYSKTNVEYYVNNTLVASIAGNFKVPTSMTFGTAGANAFQGSINLPSISITVDGKEVFTGAKEVYYAMEK